MLTGRTPGESREEDVSDESKEVKSSESVVSPAMAARGLKDSPSDQPENGDETNVVVRGFAPMVVVGRASVSVNLSSAQGVGETPLQEIQSIIDETQAVIDEMEALDFAVTPLGTVPRTDAAWVLDVAEVMFGRHRREAVFDQAVADMRIEVAEASDRGRLAVICAKLRGYWGIAKAAGLESWVRRLLVAYELIRHIR